jgi:hypothetical protein
MSDASKRSFSFAVNQEAYIDTLSWKYQTSSSDATIIPETATIRYRFVAMDVSNKTNYIVDEFELEIKSSGQTKAAACDFSTLSLTNQIQGGRTYKVGSTSFEGIHLSTTVDGLDMITPAYCGDELLMAVSVQIEEDGTYSEQFWSEDGYITAGNYVYNDEMYVDKANSRIWINITHD